MGNLLWDLSFLPLSLPPNSTCLLYVEVYNWRPTLACPRPDDSCLLRLVWLASLLQQVSYLRCVIFFPVQLFLHSSAVPCCLKPHLPFPVSSSLSLSICLCLLLSLCPVARRLVRLVFLVLSTCFLADQRKKKIFSTLLPFSSLCLSRPFLLSFDLHSRPSQMLLTFNSTVVFVMRTLRS